jgi:hypothetical protein
LETSDSEIENNGVPFWVPTNGSRKPGRPTLSKGTLEGSRNNLVRILSGGWAEIGWQLRQVGSPAELRDAFAPLQKNNDAYLLMHFLRTPKGVAATGKEVRLTRKLLEKTIERRYNAQANCNDPTNAYCEAQAAVMEARSDQLWAVRSELLKRQEKLLAVRKELRTAQQQEQDLQNELVDKEASFAQEELFNILQERRCACNPLKLANAMAGLPSVGARVSSGRCSKILCAVWPQFEYEVFRKIELIWESRKRYENLSIVDLYRQEIGKISRTTGRKRIENPLRKRLAGDFGNLKSAIEKALEVHVDLEQIPFLIASNFDKNRAQPTTALTRTLAAWERID